MFEETTRDDYCNKCGKPKRQLKKMSLTQWMFSAEACNCDSAAAPSYSSSHKPREFTSVMELCNSCGLPVLTGRIGSMTQWIFGASSCSCAAKGLRETAESGDQLRGPEAVQALFASGLMPKQAAVEQFVVADEVTALTRELGLPEDRYQAIKLVGQGAISKVFECQDRLLQRVVAIKFLIATKWTREEILRFQTEAKATSKLTHPNIVTVHDFGSTSRGQPYMVLEFFTGVSLQDLIEKKGPLPEDVAAEVGSQIASAMAFAHQKGVLHRDIKPANIMLIETGERSIVAKIIDFGIADLSSDQSLTTKGNAIVGTPSYMSPDQVQGRKPDQTADVYSLGCTLFEAMTGHPPFQAETSLEIVQMHVHNPPPTLKDALPTGVFNVATEAAIKKALEKDPANRFASMSEMQAALERIYSESAYSAGEETLEATGGTTGGAMSRFGRSPLIACAIGIVVLIVSATVLFMPNFVKKPEASTPAQSKHEEKVDELRWTTPFATLDIEEHLQGDEILKPYLNKTEEYGIVLKGANVTDKGLDYILHLKLSVLSLEGSKITDEGLRKISAIKTLKRLNLSHNPQLTDYSPLETMTDLESLYLLNNSLTNEALTHLKPLVNLHSLNISDNPLLTGVGLTNLKDAKNLRDLRMASLQFTEDGVKELATLDQVQKLQVRYSNIVDKDLEIISTMKHLKKLSIMGNKVTDKGIQKLARIKHLEELDVGTCPLLSRQGLVELQHKNWKLEINTRGAYEF